MSSADVIRVAVVQVAGLDPLRDEGFAYAEKLKSAGVKVQLESYAGLPHGFYMITHLPATKSYLDNTVNFIKKVSGYSSSI